LSRAERGRRRQAGQAQLELLGLIPVLLAVGLVLIQLMAFGYSQSLADGSAEAGAVAIAAGRDGEPAARAALPGWGRGRVDVGIDGGRVEVALRAPVLLPGLGDRLVARSVAWVGPAAVAGG
jgi:pilus assembly protein CpaE